MQTVDASIDKMLVHVALYQKRYGIQRARKPIDIEELFFTEMLFD